MISFHLDTESGKRLNFTHRIIDIDENGVITTKGDNNQVPDGYPLTIENVDAKVTAVFNQSATLLAMLKTTTGKIVVISGIIALLLIFSIIAQLLKDRRERYSITVELIDVFNDLAEKLGKTPRELFEEDISRHQETVSAIRDREDPLEAEQTLIENFK